jgi:hypothetical protein
MRSGAWCAIVDGPWTHHNGSVELRAEGGNRTRFVWTTDILPHETAEAPVPLVEQGMEVIRKTLKGTPNAKTLASVTPRPGSRSHHGSAQQDEGGVSSREQSMS